MRGASHRVPAHGRPRCFDAKDKPARVARVVLVGDEEEIALGLHTMQNMQPVSGVSLNDLQCRMNGRVSGQDLLELPRGRRGWKQVRPAAGAVCLADLQARLGPAPDRFAQGCDVLRRRSKRGGLSGKEAMADHHAACVEEVLDPGQ